MEIHSFKEKIKYIVQKSIKKLKSIDFKGFYDKSIKFLKGVPKKIYIGFFVFIIILVSLVLLLGDKKVVEKAEVNTEIEEVKNLIYGFGRKHALVSLVAEKEVRNKAIDGHYSYYVTDELISKWQKNIDIAPGRKTADPWPGRIEIDEIVKNESGVYIISGRLIELTTQDGFSDGIFSENKLNIEVGNFSGRFLITKYELLKEE